MVGFVPTGADAAAAFAAAFASGMTDSNFVIYGANLDPAQLAAAPPPNRDTALITV